MVYSHEAGKQSCPEYQKHVTGSEESGKLLVFMVNREFYPSTVMANDCSTSVIIDSGVAVIILDNSDLSRVEPRTSLHSPLLKIYPYGTKEALPLTGRFEAEVRNSERGEDGAL